MSSHNDLVGYLDLITHHQWSPLTLVAVVSLMMLRAAWAFCAERQRRVTLMQILDCAPGGTVIVQEKSRGGPRVHIWVGEGSRPNRLAPAPERVMIIVPGSIVLPARPADLDDR